MEEFRCGCAQTQPKFGILSTATEWATFKAIFRLNEAEEICVAWHNKGWVNLATTEDWDKVSGQVAEKPNLEINGNFPRRLVMEIQGRRGGW